ncbi:hypothetical protein [Curtobacterium sp. MCBD17_021]|uniref:hypothetical protein n=1 Tax=Curtobacterium sp. MCBD17_021 TaxID=2175665 RepID=UPI000DA72490|nr:hypothetical protein [Curtobacterium sp. MCBD17_021]PZE66880.1 hypothetical protein DEI83_06110 [Curtobacterium sp. MCBD17_021]
MAVDGNVAAIVGSVLTLAGIVVTAFFADRRAKRNAELEQARLAADERQKQREREQAADAGAFAQNLDLNRYIDARVDERTKALRDELSALKGVVGSLYGRLNRIREAVHKHVLEWRAAWGKQEHPPALSPTIREIMDEEYDYDTMTPEMIRDIIERPTPPG